MYEDRKKGEEWERDDRGLKCPKTVRGPASLAESASNQWLAASRHTWNWDWSKHVKSMLSWE